MWSFYTICFTKKYKNLLRKQKSSISNLSSKILSNMSKSVFRTLQILSPVPAHFSNICITFDENLGQIFFLGCITLPVIHWREFVAHSSP